MTSAKLESSILTEKCIFHIVFPFNTSQGLYIRLTVTHQPPGCSKGADEQLNAISHVQLQPKKQNTKLWAQKLLAQIHCDRDLQWGGVGTAGRAFSHCVLHYHCHNRVFRCFAIIGQAWEFRQSAAKLSL